MDTFLFFLLFFFLPGESRRSTLKCTSDIRQRGGETFVRALEALAYIRSLLGHSPNGNIRLHKAEPRLKINVESA